MPATDPFQDISPHSKRRMSLLAIATAIGIGLLFWVLDSLINASLDQEYDFVTRLISPDHHDFIPRLIGTLICTVIAGILTFLLLGERQPRRRRQLFNEFAIERSADVVLWIDRAGHIIYANLAAEQELKYSREKLLRMSIPDINPEFPPQRWERHWDELRSKKQLRFETVHMTQAKRVYPVEVTANYLKFGGQEYNCAIVRDISERKQAEELLQRNRESLRLLLDSTAEAIFGADLDSRCTFANDTCAQLLGYSSPAELIGKNMHTLIHHTRRDGSPYPAADCPGVQAQKTGESIHIDDDVFWGKNGKPIRVESWFRPILEGGRFTGTVTTFNDITERKRDEDYRQLLSEASKVLGSSLDYTATLKKTVRLVLPRLADCCCVCVLEQNGQVLAKEAAAADPSKEALVQALDIVQSQSLPVCSRGPILAAFRDRKSRLFSGMDTKDYQDFFGDPELARLMAGLGPRSWIIVPMVTRERALGVISLMRFTDESYDAKDLAVAEELARRAATAVDNGMLYNSAQDAIRQREDFLSIASHELKTPLTALQMQLRLMKSQSSENLRKMIDANEKQVGTLAELINILLDITRIRAGRIDLTVGKVDLMEEAREVLSQLEPQITQSGVQVSLKGTSAAVLGYWDRNRMKQIITNLLSNALKYGEGKPVEIEISVNDGFAKLAVHDHGPGIPKDQFGRIFRRFERAGAPRAIGGLGLGLYITRQLVEAHKGCIHVESEPGKGSTFVVELPIAMVKARAA